MNTDKKAIAIITARGGSKRIPRKNIKPFLGKPIIEYSIEAALNSGIFTEVMVSTDDEEIAEIAKKAGAKVPFLRSEKTASDTATTVDVLVEVLDRYKEMGTDFDYMCCIYPTNPFISADKLKDAYNLICEKECEEVLPVVRFSYPPQRCYAYKEDGSFGYKWEEYRNSRSQDLEPLYHDAGQFYFYDVPKFNVNKGVCTSIVPIMCPEVEVQDIDNEEDWKMAELKIEFLRRNS